MPKMEDMKLTEEQQELKMKALTIMGYVRNNPGIPIQEKLAKAVEFYTIEEKITGDHNAFLAGVAVAVTEMMLELTERRADVYIIQGAMNDAVEHHLNPSVTSIMGLMLGR